MKAMTVDSVDVRLSDRPILEGITAQIAAGGVTSIIGPNGCGKSTLLRSLARIVRPVSGTVSLDGEDVWSIDPRLFARCVALMTQSPVAPEGLRVGALVERGRTPYLGPFRPFTATDRAAVDAALEATELAGLAQRRLDRLSGGQRQRAWIAMALAQETPVLLLDEPTSYLDLPHQIDVMRLVRRLNAETGRTIVMVLHDINLAAAYSDTIVAMRDGRIVTQGAPKDVVTEEVLQALFDMPIELYPAGDSDVPLIAAR